MIANPTAATITDPKMIDYPLEEINTKLLAALSWLDGAYGKAFVMEEIVDGRKRTYPAVYTDKQEYLRLIPDENLGNFSFFDVTEGDRVEWQRNRPNWVRTTVSLIVWWDFTKVYPGDFQNRSIEHIKAEVLRAISEMVLSRSTFEISTIYDTPTSVYTGYSMVYSNPNWIGKDRVAIEAGNLFFMRPYGCLRLEGDLRYQEKTECT